MLESNDNNKKSKFDFLSNVYVSSAYQLTGSVIGLTLLGWWIDSTYNTSPLWILILSITGIVTGFYNFFKDIIRQDKKRKK